MQKTPIIALIAFVVACALALLVAPSGSALDAASSGDPGLTQRVREAAGTGRGYQSLSVAEITADSVTYAGVGSLSRRSGEAPTPETVYELGSITKTFTGLALAQAVENQTVTLGDRLDKHLPELEGSPAGGVTLDDLAAHRSGLPSMTPPQLVNMLAQWQFDATNVAGITETQILDDARSAQVASPAKYEYSNFGATLTGLALARAEGTSWTDLIGMSVLQPTEMSHTVFAASPEEIPPMAPGFKANGRVASHSCCNAQIPAGSATMTSAEDVAAYAQAMLEPDAAAELALAPREPAGNGQIGLFWQISDVDGRQVTWHNGGTAAFKTMLAIDRDAGKAVLVMGNTDRGVDDLAFGLLTGRAVAEPGLPLPGLVLFGLFGLFAIVWLIQFWRTDERKPILGPVLWLTAFMLISRALGPWPLVPGWTWAVIVGVAAAAVALAILRTRQFERPQRSLPKKLYGVFDVGLAAVFTLIGVLATIPWAR